VRQLKREISKKYQVAPADQWLVPYRADEEITNQFTADASLTDATTLEAPMNLLLRNAADKVTVRVRSGQTKRTIKLTCPLSSTVLQLKHDIHQGLNIPLSKMQLCHGDRVLIDRYPLLYFNLGSNAQLTAYDGAIPVTSQHSHLIDLQPNGVNVTMGNKSLGLK